MVRTIIGLDEAAKSMTFAGDMPEGYVAQLMVGNTRNLIEGAGLAARRSAVDSAGDRLALLVSCVGRKWLLGQRIAEEIEAVADALPGCAAQIGFYSYGEISPHAQSGVCELHNQTMTVAVLAER